MKKIRCAIYTRKSSEDGLEQEFNSLDAQYEACAAYIASQKAEGWVLLPERYDDGGLSGGSMERPGLQRLLADIDRGAVDQILVYKIDRLTRSLADFAAAITRLSLPPKCRWIMPRDRPARAMISETEVSTRPISAMQSSVASISLCLFWSLRFTPHPGFCRFRFRQI